MERLRNRTGLLLGFLTTVAPPAGADILDVRILPIAPSAGDTIRVVARIPNATSARTAQVALHWSGDIDRDCVITPARESGSRAVVFEFPPDVDLRHSSVQEYSLLEHVVPASDPPTRYDAVVTIGDTTKEAALVVDVDDPYWEECGKGRLFWLMPAISLRNMLSDRLSALHAYLARDSNDYGLDTSVVLRVDVADRDFETIYSASGQFKSASVNATGDILAVQVESDDCSIVRCVNLRENRTVFQSEGPRDRDCLWVKNTDVLIYLSSKQLAFYDPSVQSTIHVTFGVRVDHIRDAQLTEGGRIEILVTGQSRIGQTLENVYIVRYDRKNDSVEHWEIVGGPQWDLARGISPTGSAFAFVHDAAVTVASRDGAFDEWPLPIDFGLGASQPSWTANGDALLISGPSPADASGMSNGVTNE